MTVPVVRLLVYLGVGERVVVDCGENSTAPGGKGVAEREKDGNTVVG